MNERLQTRVEPARATQFAQTGSLLQRKCACGGKLEGECEECKKGGAVQRLAAGSGSPANVPHAVRDVLRSPGQPLDGDSRSFFEPRFGYDFSQVCIHTDDRAARSAEAIHALAYTFGSHVVLPSAKADVASGERRRLLSHELVHVVQQEKGGSTAFPSDGPRISQPEDLAEREADSLAQRISSGARVEVREKSSGGIHRQGQQAAPSAARKQALDEHVKEQQNVGRLIDQMKQVKADPSKGYEHPDNLTHIALEWFVPRENASSQLLGAGLSNTATPKVPLAVLTETDDSTTRDPGRGRAFFDPTVKYPQTGGTYPADPSVKVDDHLAYTDPGVFGELVQAAAKPYFALYAFLSFDYDTLQRVLIHEVQHAADRHKPSFMLIGSSPVEAAKERYKTEFRAFWLQPEPAPSKSSATVVMHPQTFSLQQFGLNQYPVTVANPANCTICPQTGQSIPTHFKNQRQQNIFWYLKDVYEKDRFDCFYVCDAGFRAMVDDFSVAESVNVGESIRIQAVLDAVANINKTPGNTDADMYQVVIAARKLDNLDRQFLQDEDRSRPFWTNIAAHVPADWLAEITELIKFGRHGHPGDFEQKKKDKVMV